MKKHLKLLLVPTPEKRMADVIGFRAIPGVLPRILRLPGESLACMLERARQASSGHGCYLLWPILNEEVPHAMAN